MHFCLKRALEYIKNEKEEEFKEYSEEIEDLVYKYTRDLQI